MKARGILYSEEMIRAKLEGRKTMTRRIIKDHINIRVTEILPTTHWPKQGDWCGRFQTSFNPDLYEITNILKCPFGKVGDLLYAKETFLILDKDHIIDGPYVYRAEATPDTEEFRKDYIKCGRPYNWKPSIFMPRAAARIIDVITGIKAERLRNITSADIVKEGVVTQEFLEKNGIDKTFTQWFKLWTSIHGDYNPDLWVWVIETRNITTKGWSDIPQTS